MTAQEARDLTTQSCSAGFTPVLDDVLRAIRSAATGGDSSLEYHFARCQQGNWCVDQLTALGYVVTPVDTSTAYTISW